MSSLRSNLEIFTLQIIVFCRFYDKVTVQLRTEEEMGSDIDIIKCSFCDFLPGSWSGNFLHMKSRKSLLLESGILALESGIQRKKSRITAWIQNPRLSWIHNKDTANYQKKGAFCQMWKSFLCGRLYDAFFWRPVDWNNKAACIFTRCFIQIRVFLVTFTASRSGLVT